MKKLFLLLFLVLLGGCVANTTTTTSNQNPGVVIFDDGIIEMVVSREFPPDTVISVKVVVEDFVWNIPSKSVRSLGRGFSVVVVDLLPVVKEYNGVKHPKKFQIKDFASKAKLKI